MRALYIYPHPDDESFGPAHVMAKQLREGHEVFLLTLTRGGATKQRFIYNKSISEMGEIRYNEMLNVAKTLQLTGMTVLNLPDSGLKELDPSEMEKVIEEYIHTIKPDVVLTYAVHGISGFHDHLISHAVVKSAFCRIRINYPYPKRLAFITLDKKTAEQSKHFRLHYSTEEEIDCVVITEDEDIRKCKAALDCYTTFKTVIDKSGVKELLRNQAVFEIFMENHKPPLDDLFAKL